MDPDKKLLEIENCKLELEKHKNLRDEQFWFTASTVSFNGFLLVQAEIPAGFAVIAATLISLISGYLVVSRLVTVAEIPLPDAPKPAETTALGRAQYTWQLAIVSARLLPYVVAEMSGTAFYLLLIMIGFIGVVWKHWLAVTS